MLRNAKDVKKEKREIKFKTHKKSLAQIINKESFQCGLFLVHLQALPLLCTDT